ARLHGRRPGAGPGAFGTPKKSMTWGRDAGILIDYFLRCEKELSRQQVRRLRRAKISQPTQGSGRGCSVETFGPPVSPMTDVTRMLSAIEQGDPHAAEQPRPDP